MDSNKNGTLTMESGRDENSSEKVSETIQEIMSTHSSSAKVCEAVGTSFTEQGKKDRGRVTLQSQDCESYDFGCLSHALVHMLCSAKLEVLLENNETRYL